MSERCDHCMRSGDELAKLELSVETVCEECAEDSVTALLETENAKLRERIAELETLLSATAPEGEVTLPTNDPASAAWDLAEANRVKP